MIIVDVEFMDMVNLETKWDRLNLCYSINYDKLTDTLNLYKTPSDLTTRQPFKRFHDVTNFSVFTYFDQKIKPDPEF